MPIPFSGNTDCYQPAERRYRLTRQLLAVCLKYRNPLSIITKNALILRDADCHGGQLSDSRFGTRMRVEGKVAESIRQLLWSAKEVFFPRWLTSLRFVALQPGLAALFVW